LRSEAKFVCANAGLAQDLTETTFNPADSDENKERFDTYLDMEPLSGTFK